MNKEIFKKILEINEQSCHGKFYPQDAQEECEKIHKIVNKIIEDEREKQRKQRLEAVLNFCEECEKE